MGCSTAPSRRPALGQRLPAQQIAREEAHQRTWLAGTRPPPAGLCGRELADRSRIVVETAHWLAVVPFWAAWPFETLLLPKAHVPPCWISPGNSKQDLAIALKELTSRYDNLFQCSFPYSMGWHLPRPFPTAPRRGNCTPTSIRPAALRHGAQIHGGFEMLAETQRDLTPEQAAERLRALSPIHYNDQNQASEEAL